jgi:hypothetical protein
VISIALSTQFSRPELLRVLSTHLRDRRQIEIPESILTRARDAVRGRLRKPAREQADEGSGGDDGAACVTSLDRNPFRVLGASVRDSERRLVELEAERAAAESADACVDACNTLRNPRTRLRAEIGWLPGVSPSRANELVKLARGEPERLRPDTMLPPLARANLLACALEGGHITGQEALCEWIVDLGRTSDRLDSTEVVRCINEDRAIAQIPGVKINEAVEAELAQRQKYYQETIVARLDSLDASMLCDVVTKAVASATSNGSQSAPSVVDEVAALYEAKAAAALDKGATAVRHVLKELPATSICEEAVVAGCVDQLGPILRSWGRVAKPVQLAMKARGQRHALSHELVAEVRQAAGDMWDRQPMIVVAKRITELLSEVFSDLPDWTERLDGDKKSLAEREEEKRHEARLKAVQEQCDGISRDASSAPGTANALALRTLESAERTCASLTQEGVPTRLTAGVRDRFAMAVLQCVMEYGKASQLWTECLGLAQRALQLATSSEAHAAIEGTLAAMRKREKRMIGLTPIKSAPALRTVNGIGGMLYGAIERDPEDGSYLTTYYVVFFFLPIFPVTRYRVTSSGNSYNFIGKAPLRGFDKWHIAVVVAAILGWIVYANLT